MKKKNCDIFRNNFKNDKHVYFPKIICATYDIIISEFAVNCDEFENIPQYSQLKSCINFAIIISKMMLVDNFVHLDLHEGNWKVRKLNDIDYQIVIFDYGIIYKNDDINISRQLWDAFELNDITLIKEILPTMIIGEINENVLNEFNSIVDYYAENTLDLTYMLDKLNNMLSQYNCKLSSFTLNLALTVTLIENILKKHNVINNVRPVIRHNLIIRQKQLDCISFCRSKNVYLDYLEYVEQKIKRNDSLSDHSRSGLFFNNTNLQLDLPE